MNRRNLLTAALLTVPTLACSRPKSLTMFQNVDSTTHPDKTVTKALDPLQIITSCRITSGPAALIGAYRIVPSVGRINWYFSNLGLIGTARFLPKDHVRNYLDVYIRNLKADCTIDDFEADLTTPMKPDSHDSYAATFLSLAAHYVALTNDTNWYYSNVATLKRIAYFNLATQTKPNQLTRVFQSPDPYDVGFFMDNCEVHRGLKDFAQLLRRFGDESDAVYYDAFAETIAYGLMNLWDPVMSGFRPSDAHNTAIRAFYPGVTCQIFAQAFDVTPLSAYYDKAWTYVQRYAPDWSRRRYDDFPWAILGAVSAKRKVLQPARWTLMHMNEQARLGNYNMLTINELGWYQRINNLLNNQPEI